MAEEKKEEPQPVVNEDASEEVDAGSLELVDEIGEEEPAKEGEGSGEAEENEGTTEEKKDVEMAEDDAMKSVVDFLDVMQQLPTDMIDKLSAAKKAAEKAKEAVKKEEVKVVKVEPKPKVVEEKEASSSPKTELTKADKKKIVPLFGYGYWNLYRTAQLINRALDSNVEGVVPTDPYEVFAHPKAKRLPGKPFKKGPGSPFMDRGERVICKGKFTRPKSSRTAAFWMRAVTKSSALELGLTGPFAFPKGSAVNGRPFDPKHYGLPRSCSLSYGKHEEPGGPGVTLGFPEDHGWFRDGIEMIHVKNVVFIKAWKSRPPSLKGLEHTAADVERLSEIQSFALTTFLTNLRKMAERHPELCDEFAALEPHVRDLRDLDALMVNRAKVNFDLVVKTSKKIVMDGTPVDQATFRRYWDLLPSRHLFPAIGDDRKFRPVVPDRKQIEAREREEREREMRRRDEEEKRRMDEEKRRLDEERRMLEVERRREEDRRLQLELEERRRLEIQLEDRRRLEAQVEERRRLEAQVEERRRLEAEDQFRRRAEKRPSRRSPSPSYNAGPDRRRPRYENDGRDGGGYPSYGDGGRGGYGDGGRGRYEAEVPSAGPSGDDYRRSGDGGRGGYGPEGPSAGASGDRYGRAGDGGNEAAEKRLQLMSEVERLLASAKQTMGGERRGGNRY